MVNISQCNSKTNSSVCVHVHPGYLEWVETGDDAAVLHMAGARGVSELAFGVRTRAGSSLELSAHLQRQPLGVATHGHIDGHGGPSASGGWAEGWGGAARRDEAQKLQKMSTVARRSSDYQSRNENQTLLWTGRGHSLLISQWGSMTRIWDQFKVRQGERWIERAEVE